MMHLFLAALRIATARQTVIIAEYYITRMEGDASAGS